MAVKSQEISLGDSLPSDAGVERDSTTAFGAAVINHSGFISWVFGQQILMADGWRWGSQWSQAAL